MKDTHQIKKFFNQAKHTYDDHCQLQLDIGHTLINTIKNISSSYAATIDLGCGTGLVTEKLAKTISYQHLHAIDIANELLTKAHQRMTALNVTLYEADFNHLNINDLQFDLAFSNMALQWSADLNQTLLAIANCVKTNGTLAFSIPLPGTLIELKHYYALNHFLSTESIARSLQSSGFTLIHQHTDTITLPFDSLYLALKSIKNMGANYTGKHLHKGLRGKSFLHLHVLQRLTYHIGYFIAKKTS